MAKEDDSFIADMIELFSDNRHKTKKGRAQLEAEKKKRERIKARHKAAGAKDPDKLAPFTYKGQDILEARRKRKEQIERALRE